MKVLFASNNKVDWGNNPTTSVDGTKYDNTRVPYGIVLPGSVTVPMVDFHKASTTGVVWYHFRIKLLNTFGISQDGYMIDIMDSAGAILGRVDFLNGFAAAQVYGDSMVTGIYGGAWGNTAILDVDMSISVTASTILMNLYLGQALISTASVANVVSGRTSARRMDFNLFDVLGTHVFSEFIAAETDTRGSRLRRLDVGNAFGTYNGWAGAITALSDDDTTTGLISNTAAQRTSGAIAAITGAPIIGALVSVSQASHGATGPYQMKQTVRMAGINYDGILTPLSQNKNVYTECWELNPAVTAAWTATSVNTVEAGLLSVT